MRSTVLTLAAATLALAACDRRTGPTAIPRQTFVMANVEMRSVPDTAPNGDALRKAALKKYGLTQADLERFVSANARRPQFMANVWRDIADSLQRRFDVPLQSHGPPSGGGPTPPTGIPAPVAGPAQTPSNAGPAQPPPLPPPPGAAIAPPPPAMMRPPAPRPAQPAPEAVDRPRPMVKNIGGDAPLPPPRIPRPTGPPPDAQHGFVPAHPDTLARTPAPR